MKFFTLTVSMLIWLNICIVVNLSNCTLSIIKNAVPTIFKLFPLHYATIIQPDEDIHSFDAFARSYSQSDIREWLLGPSDSRFCHDISSKIKKLKTNKIYKVLILALFPFFSSHFTSFSYKVPPKQHGISSLAPMHLYWTPSC